MSLTNNLQTIFESKLPQGAKHQFPYFELAHVFDALLNNTETNKHNAAVLLQNNLWFQYLNASYKQENTNETKVKNVVVELEMERKDNLVEKELNEQNKIEALNILDTTDKINEIEEKNTLSDENNKIDLKLNTDLSEQTKVEYNSSISKMLEESNLKGILDNIKNNDANAVVDQSKDIFEPLYTNDYFESQGVKTSAAPVDRLTVQVRSFTQWLKTMKKIEALPTKIETEEEVIIHHNVINMAENSVKNNQVYTETMVEVLINQGRTNAAIDLLEKLSLQDPNKSRYFAAQIDKLKKQ
jgi:predicted Zn-dependent protease